MYRFFKEPVLDSLFSSVGCTLAMIWAPVYGGVFRFASALAIAKFRGHITLMRKGDVQCPDCREGFRRIELASMRGEPGEYRCAICDARLEKMSGITYVAYRLTVPPESALVDRALRCDGTSG